MTKLRLARMGEKLLVFDDTTHETVRELIEPNGHAMAEGNRSEWIIDEVVFDATKSGSACYTWDRSGNRVKYERVRYVKVGDEVVREVERTIWKSLD